MAPLRGLAPCESPRHCMLRGRRQTVTRGKRGASGLGSAQHDRKHGDRSRCRTRAGSGAPIVVGHEPHAVLCVRARARARAGRGRGRGERDGLRMQVVALWQLKLRQVWREAAAGVRQDAASARSGAAIVVPTRQKGWPYACRAGVASGSSRLFVQPALEEILHSRTAQELPSLASVFLP